MRVLTTKQLAEVYGCAVTNIKDNFRKSKKHFVEGVDYFKCIGGDLRRLKAILSRLGNFEVPSPIPKLASSVILWTEKGCVRHLRQGIHLQQIKACVDMFKKLLAEIELANAASRK